MLESYVIFYIIKYLKDKKIKISDDMTEYCDKIAEKVKEMAKGDKFHYIEYGKRLGKYLEKNYNFKIISYDTSSRIKKHIILGTIEKGTFCSFEKNKICKSIIPFKFGKICKFNKNSNLIRNFTEEYEEINSKFYRKFKKVESFNRIDEDDVYGKLYMPINKLIVDSFNRKRKHAKNLLNHIMTIPNGSLIINTTRTRFQVYEFRYDEEDPTGMYLKIDNDDPAIVIVHFNTGIEFKMKLSFNSNQVNETLSLKYQIEINNDEDYLIKIAKDSI